MEKRNWKIILCSRSMVKIQALNDVIRNKDNLELYAKVNTDSAKTVPQPINSGEICAYKRIQKTEDFLQMTQSKNFLFI